MLKRATCTLLLASTIAATWTLYRSSAAASASSPQAAAFDPLATDAAIRHRNGQPNHWRAYVLQQNRY